MKYPTPARNRIMATATWNELSFVIINVPKNIQYAPLPQYDVNNLNFVSTYPNLNSDNTNTPPNQM